MSISKYSQKPRQSLTKKISLPIHSQLYVLFYSHSFCKFLFEMIMNLSNKKKPPKKIFHFLH